MTLEDAIRAALAAEVAPVLAELRRLADEVARFRDALPPRVVTVEEAARQLGISTSTVRRQVKAGELPSLRIGRQLRVDLTRVRPT